MLNKIKKFILFTKVYGLRGIIIKLKKRFFKPIKNFNEIEHYFSNKSGIEIGGPSRFFKLCLPIYDKISNLDGVNFSTSTIWTGPIDEKNGYMIDGIRVGKQYILDAVDLTSIKNETYDFVLSCNSIEHIANPIKAIEQWLSVLKKGGVLVIIAPRKESNFDHNRDIVKFDHLIADYQNKIKEDDLTHLEQILTLHDLKMDPPAGTLAACRA
jgi:SAM-dependent methyltransferase